MQGLWEEAVSVNRQLIDLGFYDVDTWNRLGKATLESDDRDAAREAFENALSLSPSNVIARKNLERLSLFGRKQINGGRKRQVSSSFFIEESNKTAQVTLYFSGDVIASLLVQSGEPVDLEQVSGELVVYDGRGYLLGALPQTLGNRLSGLMDRGNIYEGAIFRVAKESVTILLREIYRHSDNRNMHSFPSVQTARQHNGKNDYSEQFDPEDELSDISEAIVDR
jgi:tetratricopeptide (TPR) repeat protein